MVRLRETKNSLREEVESCIILVHDALFYLRQFVCVSGDGPALAYL